MRLARNSTIGRGVSAAVLVIVGGPILGAGTSYKPGDVGMIAGGTVLVTLALTTFAGSTVSFGYWLRERLRAPAPGD